MHKINVKYYITITGSTAVISVVSEGLCISWEKHKTFCTACMYPKVHFPMGKEVWSAVCWWEGSNLKWRPHHTIEWGTAIGFGNEKVIFKYFRGSGYLGVTFDSGLGWWVGSNSRWSLVHFDEKCTLVYLILQQSGILNVISY